MTVVPAIRPLGRNDAAEAAGLHHDAMPDPWGAAAWATLIADPLVIGLGAGTPLVGAILVRAVADEAEVLTIAVAVAARRGGIGRRMLEAALREARDRGAATAFLEVAADNIPALALYRGSGFAEVGRRAGYYRREGALVDALLMSRAIGTNGQPGQF